MSVMNQADLIAAKRRQQTRRRVYVSVEVDLAEIDTEDMREELARRHDDDCASNDELPDPEALRRIRTLILCGQRDAAFSAMQDLIRDTLGTAL